MGDESSRLAAGFVRPWIYQLSQENTAMADSKRHGWSKKRKIAIGAVTLIAATVLYHWLQLWGMAVLAVGLFVFWKFVPLPHKTKLAASLVFTAVFIFAAGAWNDYNLPPKINIDNALADSIGTDNNTSSYTVTGNIASHKSVKLTINGTNVALNSSDDFSYKTSLKEGDNTYTLIATSGSGEDREVLTIHRNSKAEDVADNSSSSSSDNNNTTPQTSTTPSKQQQVNDWNNKYGYMFQTLSNDFSKLSKDAGNQDVSAVGNDCNTLNADVTTAQAFPAIPDAQAASDFSTALAYFQTGSKDCVTAVDNSDGSGLIKASNEMSQGNDKITATGGDMKAAE